MHHFQFTNPHFILLIMINISITEMFNLIKMMASKGEVRVYLLLMNKQIIQLDNHRSRTACHSIIGYVDLSQKLVHQFLGSQSSNVTATKLFQFYFF